MNSSVDCPKCNTQMEMSDTIDVMKCPSCGHEVDRGEDEDGD